MHALNFVMEQTSNFKLSTELSASAILARGRV